MRPRLPSFRAIATAVVLLLAVAIPAPIAASSVPPRQAARPAAAKKAPRFVDGEIIVKFKSGVTLTTADAAVRAASPQARIAKSMKEAPGTALVRFPKELPVPAQVARFKAMPDVLYATPNYITSLPDPVASTRTPPTDKITRQYQAKGSDRPVEKSVPTDVLRRMATFPTDPDLWKNWGWSSVGADIIWPEGTASPVVAVLDTGVDYLHPDLAGKIVKGPDLINDDLDPMDDNGHGTHVAGIISAKLNNATGLGGVSNGSVIAIKVLNSSGEGTVFDLEAGLYSAANNLSVKVINVSLGLSDPGTANALDELYKAVQYAVETKGKLLVAAAGNYGDNTPFFPAYYSQTFPGKVMAVASNGVWVQDLIDPNTEYWHPECRSDFSNYGGWITITAPGYSIYSTTPYDKAFYMNQYNAVPMRYAYLSGTSMAAPFVAGAAARTWSLHPTWLNTQVKGQLVAQGRPEGAGYPTGDLRGKLLEDGLTECWPASMSDSIALVSVDRAMGRQEIAGEVYDAYTALPLKGAQATALTNPGNVLKGYGGKLDNLGDTYFYLVNVPRGTAYNVRIAMNGYTPSPQLFASITSSDLPAWYSGWYAGQVSLPPNKPNNVFVTDWDAFYNLTDLDSYLWLPPAPPGSLGVGNCVIGYGQYLGTLGCGGTGTLLEFPMARWMRDGGPMDVGSEATSIKTLYNTTLGGGPYKFYVHDSSPGDGTGFSDGWPTVRLWRGGVIIRTVWHWDATDAPGLSCVQSGGTDQCPLWYVGDLNSAGVFTPVNEYTNAPPYTMAKGTITTQKKNP